MNISVELTLLPLHNDFENHIIQFIKKLRTSEFTVMENPMSTQVYGNFDKVMSFLSSEIKASFQNQENVVVNLKIVKSDRSNYDSNF